MDDGRGWLYLNGCEVLNNARFLANLSAYNRANVSFGTRILATGLDPCPTYHLNPCSNPQWDPIVMTDPATSPWVDLGSPQSQRFIGYWVDDVTVSRIGARAVEQRGQRRGAANFGAWRYQQRELSYSVILCALDQGGMQWGIDWLTEILGGCGPCPELEAMYRLGCPDITTPDQDMWILKGVGLIDAPSWGEPITDKSGCVLRRVTFVLGAADPCRYKCPVVALNRTRVPWNAGACMNGSKWVCGPFPELRLFANMPPAGDLGTTDALVTIEAGVTGSPFFILKGGPNPNGYDSFAPLDWCMQMLVGGLGAHETLTIDSSTERVWHTTAGGVVSDGLRWVIPPALGAPTYFSQAGCASGLVYLEPSSGRCLADDIYITIDSVHRVCL